MMYKIDKWFCSVFHILEQKLDEFGDKRCRNRNWLNLSKVLVYHSICNNNFQLVKNNYDRTFKHNTIFDNQVHPFDPIIGLIINNFLNKRHLIKTKKFIINV
jgi:hypothetical protein